MVIDPAEHDYRNIYKLMVEVIIPRPIAFVSSVSPEGVRNLAPFSFFTGISANPPVVCFCPMVRARVSVAPPAGYGTINFSGWLG